MKYLKAALVLAACLLLCGCTAKENDTGGTAGSGSGQADIVSEDNTTPSDTADGVVSVVREYAGSLTWTNQTILDTDNGERIIYRAADGTSIVSAAANKDTVYVILGNDDLWGVSTYKLFAIDRDGSTYEGVLEENDSVREIDEFINKEVNIKLGYYNGILYLRYSIFGDGAKEGVYAYEVQENGIVQRTENDLCKVINGLLEDGYGFCPYFEQFMSCLNEDGILLLWDKESSVVSLFDQEGGLIRECSVEPSVMALWAADGRMAVGYDSDYFYIYNLEDGNAVNKVERANEYDHSKYVCAVQDGYLYYYSLGEYTGSGSERYIYQYDLSGGTEKLLYETVSSVPGQPYWDNGIGRFTVLNDHCYFMDYSDGGLWWFSLDLSADDHAVTRLEQVNDYRGIFDVASVGCVYKEYTCDVCGEALFTYYFETVQLLEEEIPGAEKINEFLQEMIDGRISSSEGRVQNMDDEFAMYADVPEEDHLHVNESRRTHFEGITRYVFESLDDGMQYSCLEADYNDHDNFGSVSGEHYRRRYLFNPEDGAHITLGDICGISEEDFSKLAAEYTMVDYRDNSETYYLGSEEAVYNWICEYVGFDYEMRLAPEGVVIEYGRYALRSGYPSYPSYFEVTIPYEALGIRLVDINGVNEWYVRT